MLRRRVAGGLCTSAIMIAAFAAPAQAGVPRGRYRCVRSDDTLLPGFRILRNRRYYANFGSAGSYTGTYRVRGRRFTFGSGSFAQLGAGRIARNARGRVTIHFHPRGSMRETCTHQ